VGGLGSGGGLGFGGSGYYGNGFGSGNGYGSGGASSPPDSGPTVPNGLGNQGWPPPRGPEARFPHAPTPPSGPQKAGPPPKQPKKIVSIKGVISIGLILVSLTAAVSTYVVVHALTFTPLSVTTTAFAQQCASATSALPARTTTVQNIDSSPLSWQAKISDVDPAGTLWATLTPASGTLQPNQSLTLTLAPAQTLCNDISRSTAPTIFNVTLSAAQKSLTLKDTVTPAPTLAFMALQGTLANAQQMCADTQALDPLTLTLDNSGSNVPVTWQLSITDTDPAGTVWATPSATRGSVAAEKTATLTLTPTPTLCGDLRQTQAPVPYTANFTYNYKDQTSTATFTDTVAPPMIVGFQGTLMATAQTCMLLQPLPAIPVTLDNSGSNVPITWNLTISDTDSLGDLWASVDTASGTIAPAQQAMLTLTPVSSLCLALVGKPATNFTAVLRYNGGGKSGRMVLVDSVTGPQAVNNLQVGPQTTFQQGCNSASDTPAALQLTLDNSQSTVSVAWQANTTDTDPQGNTWASASPASGTVLAGQTATLAITPGSALCGDMFFSTSSLTYTAVLSQTALGQTNNVTISDTVAPPPAVNNFRLTSASVRQDCNRSNPLQPFTVTLDNSQSNTAVDWSITSTSWESASPTGGTVPAGRTAPLTITPNPNLCASLGVGTQTASLQATVSDSALGQTNKATIRDTVTPVRPLVNFNASPQTFKEDCNVSFQLPALNVTLDNSQSNVSVQWQISITQLDPAKRVWASASATSGTVNAGTTGTVSITPFYVSFINSFCNDLGWGSQTFAYTAVISYTASTGQSGSFTITDNVTQCTPSNCG
jgi:hypothetical protein